VTAAGTDQGALVSRTDLLVRPDSSRVVARLFLPGQEAATAGRSRASEVIDRCLALGEASAGEELARVTAAHHSRHRRYVHVLDTHFAALAHRMDGASEVSPQMRRLIGACFTQEYAVEAAGLFNPSLVRHPEDDASTGRMRFVMSARAVGEGHVSSVVFLTGSVVLGGDGRPVVTLDPRSPFQSAGHHRVGVIDRERTRREAIAAGADDDTVDFVLGSLPPTLSDDALEKALRSLHDQELTRTQAAHTAAALRMSASASYELRFDAETALSERVIMPAAQRESHGLEDARFVRFTEDDGTLTYLATYTAFDGSRIGSARLQTDDFRGFRAAPLTGPAAANKGMALFPRRVGGRYAALSRWDRENNALALSDDGHHWDEAVRLQAPSRAWELVQLGNCGSPLETPAGWLALTHGVGPMRTYAIGALLLDLDDPARVVGRLDEPLLRPAAAERDGYVPNVVYSCGGVQFGRFYLLPYGCSDSTIRMAVVDLPRLLDALSNGTTHADGRIA
jgi:predicted GH43/DUF377 family glycosyl hydrolase